ncbi:hypothetical protein HPB50_026535 [Hyalomma asiaticum]|uniref:Uncharacterized protein n=1 Tax=Hyalomma asiaticum TaxID=266040 RepID=A0ACB7RSV1_HYAAI|nr:hypothetical protein HPB50_026535 [Hyalomma asiaticum]
MFTPESTQTPTKPSFPLAAALATPPSVVELSSDDSSEVSMPMTKSPRGKRASASVTPRQRKSEAPTAAAVQKRSAKPSSKPDDPLLWPEAQMSDQSSLAAPKRRKFFKTKDTDVDELFKTSFI